MEQIYYSAPAPIFVGALLEDHPKWDYWNDILDVTIAIFKKKTNQTFKEIQEALCFSGGNENACINNGNNQIEKYPRAAYFSIPRETFWDYKDHAKTEEERILLLAYLAIKSIIGKERGYCHVTNEYWLSRMSGCSGLASEKKVVDKTEPATKNVRTTIDGKRQTVTEEYQKPVSYKMVRVFHPIVQKYSSHYHLQKIKNLLFEYYHVSTYSNTRGFYASCSMDLSELIRSVKAQKNSRQESKLKQETKRIEDEMRESSS